MSVKPRTNYILDALILVLFIVVMVSGLLLWFVYPHSGERAGQFSPRGEGRGARAAEVEETSAMTILGLSRHDMGTVHDWAGLAMGGLVLVHVVFHWKWVVCQTKQIFRRQRAAPRKQPCPDPCVSESTVGTWDTTK